MQRKSNQSIFVSDASWEWNGNTIQVNEKKGWTNAKGLPTKAPLYKSDALPGREASTF